jgi:hypothetical protein
MNTNNKVIVGILIALVLSAIVFKVVREKVFVTYTDQVSKFSIDLPRDWTLRDKTNSTATTSTQFGNDSMTIVVKRFSRTEITEQALRFMGEDEFMNFLTDQLREDIDGYVVVATSSEMINNISYFTINGSYTGKQSKKEVTQKTYIHINKEAYYIIGIDVYKDIWEKNMGEINKIILTLKLL